MRSVSADFRKALFDENSGEVPVLLLTISHPDLPSGDILLSSDNRDLFDFEEQLRGTTSRGLRYAFLPMSITLPEDGPDAAPTIQLTLYDVAQEVSPLLEASINRAFVTAEIVLADAPDEVEVQFAVFELTDAVIQADNVVLSLTVDALAGEPFPADKFTPSSFPGLWSRFQ